MENFEAGVYHWNDYKKKSIEDTWISENTFHSTNAYTTSQIQFSSLLL